MVDLISLGWDTSQRRHFLKAMLFKLVFHILVKKFKCFSESSICSIQARKVLILTTLRRISSPNTISFKMLKMMLKIWRHTKPKLNYLRTRIINLKSLKIG